MSSFLHTEQLLLSRFFGPGFARDAVRECLVKARLVRIATAFFEPGGWEILDDVLEGKETRLLIGREEGAADKIESLLNEFFLELQKGDLRNRPAVLKKILSALRQGKLTIKITSQRIAGSLDVRYLHHHAKLYISDSNGVIVTSANFTRNGLLFSREAGYLVTQAADVAYFVESFDSFFDRAESMTAVFIEALEELLELREPEEVYQRSLIEIYGLPDDTFSGNLLSPAHYQKPIISGLVRSITDYSGAFLVASTGLGKTVIASHTVSLLKTRGLIQAALVFAPAGLKDMWANAMRSARISSREFSYQILSIDDWKTYRQSMLLDDELNRDLQNVLLILDESHHMRNDEDSETEASLRHSRIRRAVERGAKILMLTATPYSRGVEDINNQLQLLPKRSVTGMFFTSEQKWRIDKPSQLPETSPCTVLTAPTVVKYFSHKDELGNRYVEFGNGRRMYFPKFIHLRTQAFQNAFNDYLKELKNSNLLRKKAAAEYEENLFEEPEIAGKIDYLFEARLLHQFCSSKAQIKATLEKLNREGGYEKMRFADQAKLTVLTTDLLRRLKKTLDAKAIALKEIVTEHQGEKLVIFCIYKETAKELAAFLADEFPQLQIRSTVDALPDALENTLDYFAPIANGRIIPGEAETEFSARFIENRVDILIASEAISEGYNLQDARILINYDLPWSILQLAQRMGRLMRPWHQVRELIIYNFLPDTMFDTELKHGETWRLRLDKRNREHQSFANLPVILPSGNDAVNLESLSTALQSFDSADLDLNEAMNFIGHATQVTTSSVLDDLAQIGESEQERIRRIRSGFRSRVAAEPDSPALYLLIGLRGSVFPALFNAKAELISAPHEISRPLEILRRSRHEPVVEKGIDPAWLDEFQEKCLQAWLNECSEKRERARIICALHYA